MSMRGEPRTRVEFVEGEGRTKQAFKDDCDINKIMSRYERSGLVTHLAQGVPVFADVSEVGTFREAVEVVRQGQEYFAGLPAKVRDAFDNDAAAFVDYVTGPKFDVAALRAAGLELVDDDPSNDAAAQEALDPDTPAPEEPASPASEE